MSDEQTVNAANEAPIDDIELAYREAMAALLQTGGWADLWLHIMTNCGPKT